jgi:urease accessory protein
MTNDWLLWQLADSAFPSGGFAHSGGLEAAVQLGFVVDSTSLELFVDSALLQISNGVARFALASWEKPDDFALIDRECDLFLNNHISRRASRAQGQALLSSAAKAFGEAVADDSVSRWALMARQERLASHLAPVFGLVARSLGIPSAQALSLFLFIHLRGYISAAVRLGIVGPIQAQQIQSAAAKRSIKESPSREPVQINPMLDLLQMTQDRLYSRLFQS